jgi:hypothetical protein
VATSTVNPGTQRSDNWQLEPLLTFFALVAFVIYATFRAFENNYFEVPGTQYISPFYSPYIPHILAALGIHLKSLEHVLPNGSLSWIVSPALFILWAPAGFRASCYFYRKAYYRSIFAAPAACAVGPKNGNPLFALLNNTFGNILGKGAKYMGERSLPMVLMNLHRYFFYIALLLILVHVIDTVTAMFLPGFSGIRFGVGNVLLIIDLILLSAYVLGCHSWRHILGGQLDCFSACPISEIRHHAYKRQGILNASHMQFAWISMFWIAFVDLYISLVSKGVLTDIVFYSHPWKGMF